VRYIPAKKIVLPVKNEIDLFGSTHMMNIYRGCDHGCIYCDSRSECYRSGRPEEDFGTVCAKENALFLIEKELQARRRHDTAKKIIGTGSMSDPYNSFEKESELTRGALLLFDKYRCGVCVITKSALVSRDADLFTSISKHSPVNVGITVTTTDETLCREIEPNASAPARRFKAIKTLSEADVFCGVHMNPILPFLTDNEKNIRKIVEEAAAAGSSYVLCYGFGMTLRKGNREYYYENLDKARPGLKEKYMKTYGRKYNVVCENAEELAAAFAGECEKNDLLYRVKDINAAWKKEKTKQKKLFEYE
jgi:DNA repair photolyase